MNEYSNDGMYRKDKTEILGERHYTVWVVDG